MDNMGFEPITVKRIDSIEEAWATAKIEDRVRTEYNFWKQFQPVTFQDLVNRIVGNITEILKSSCGRS